MKDKNGKTVLSQQPLGLALSFYLASEVRRFLRLSGRLNSRLGLH